MVPRTERLRRDIGLSLMERDGDGYGEMKKNETFERVGTWLSVVDVDGDGDPDVSMDKTDGHEFQWLENKSEQKRK